MADPIDIVVDLDALQQLGNRLALIKDSLEHVDDDVTAYAAALGSAKVAHKLNDFVHGWKDGRKKIKDNVGKLVDKVQGVAETYLEQEQALANQYRSSGEVGSSVVPHAR